MTDVAFHRRPVCGVFHVNGNALFLDQVLVGLIVDDDVTDRICELLNTHGLGVVEALTNGEHP